MFLTYDDLAKLFHHSRGIKDEFQFHTVSTSATLNQPRGLFIPAFDDSGELKDAIKNGAIGAIWDESIEQPSYVPSQFPIFYTINLKEALEAILIMYVDKLDGEKKEIMNMTKFLFIEERLLNTGLASYDKPVLEFIKIEKGRG